MLPNLIPDTRLSLTPLIPTYRKLVAFLHSIQGEKYANYRRMDDEIWNQVGTPQETSNWINPEEWIPLRLNGEEQRIALKMWGESQGILNPRYTRGCWWLTQRHDLLSRNGQDSLELTSIGREFLNDSEGDPAARIDQAEGLLTVLQIVAEHSPGKRGEILPGYIEFCKTYTTFQAESVHKSSLYDRLVNLVDRNLIVHNGLLYSITETGIDRLQRYASSIIGRAVTTGITNLQKIAQTISREARQSLYDYLAHMDPYKFEQLVKLLLEEMGYENVEVTSRSNDGGVDVTADIELGITSVREVVQVKRHVGTINRPVLDQLRGSLYRFRAMRGTIITIGKFAAGAKRISLEQGAAPITLIDGEKLIDLLMENEIGLSKKAVSYFEFDDSKLNQFEERLDDRVQLL